MKKTPKKNKTYFLELEFDIGQVTTSLQYRFICSDKKDYKANNKGGLAGTFEFRAGDKLRTRVIAHANRYNHDRKATDLDLWINDFTLTSLARYQPSFGTDFDMNLSPFHRIKACVNTDNWGPQQHSHDKQHSTVTIESLNALEIISGDGQWEISVYLSVSFLINGNEIRRAFYFDPEGSVSSGIGIGP